MAIIMPKDAEGNAENYPKEVDFLMKNPTNSEEFQAFMEKSNKVDKEKSNKAKEEKETTSKAKAKKGKKKKA